MTSSLSSVAWFGPWLASWLTQQVVRCSPVLSSKKKEWADAASACHAFSEKCLRPGTRHTNSSLTRFRRRMIAYFIRSHANRCGALSRPLPRGLHTITRDRVSCVPSRVIEVYAIRKLKLLSLFYRKGGSISPSLSDLGGPVRKQPWLLSTHRTRMGQESGCGSLCDLAALATCRDTKRDGAWRQLCPPRAKGTSTPTVLSPVRAPKTLKRGSQTTPPTLASAIFGISK